MVGAARLAATLRVSMMAVGVVVIGFGTSVPEVLVSGLAAGRGELDVGVGNVIGSNVTNLALVLGIAAVVRAQRVRSQTVGREAPMAVSAVVVFAVVVQGGLSTWEGVLLMAAMGVSVLWVLRTAREPDLLDAELTESLGEPREVAVAAAQAVGGLAGTVLGAELFLRGALDIAEALGVAGGVIGLTLVAFGTSLPELVTVVQAARRDHGDLVLGNLLGSTTFNALFVGGVAALVGPAAIHDRGLTLVGPLFMVGVTVAVWAMMRTAFVVNRWEAVGLLACYGAFVAMVV